MCGPKGTNDIIHSSMTANLSAAHERIGSIKQQKTRYRHGIYRRCLASPLRAGVLCRGGGAKPRIKSAAINRVF